MTAAPAASMERTAVSTNWSGALWMVAASGAIWVAAALGALLTLLAAALTAWAYPAQPAHTVCRTGPSASPAFVTELSAAPVATPGTATRRYAELDEREMQPSARAPPQERVSVHRVSGAI